MKHRILYLLLAISSTVAAQKKLQYNLNIGDSFIVEQDAKQHITQNLNGEEQILENHLIGVMYFETIEVTDENYTLAMSFKRLKMLMSSPTLGELSNADTESTDSTNVTNMLFKGLLDVPVTIIMDKSGQITSVTGGDLLISNMYASASIDDPEIIAASKEQLEKQFGSAALSNSFEQMTYFYPVEAVSNAGKWSNTYNGDLTAKNEWQLDSLTKDALTITGTATTTMTTKDDNISMILSGTQKTTINANPITGLFKDITVVGENSGDTLFQAQNMTIPTQIQSTITYKITQ